MKKNDFLKNYNFLFENCGSIWWSVAWDIQILMDNILRNLTKMVFHQIFFFKITKY